MKEYLAHLCDGVSLNLLTGEVRSRDGRRDAYDMYFQDFHFHYPITWKDGVIYIGEEKARETEPFCSIAKLQCADTIKALHDHLPIRPTEDGEALSVQINGRPYKSRLYYVGGTAFIGTEEAGNSQVYLEYDITRSFIDNFFGRKTTGEWPTGTIAEQTRFIDYINTHFIRHDLEVTVDSDGLRCGTNIYKIVQLKNDKYILRGDISEIAKICGFKDVSIFRDALGVKSRGVFPEFDTAEELIVTLKKII